MPVAKRCERHMFHPSAPFTAGAPNCFCMACNASMTRPLSQRLCDYEDGRHAITDPCLRTFAVRSEILSLSGHPGIWHDESSDWHSLGRVRHTDQIQLTPSNTSPFLKKQPYYSGVAPFTPSIGCQPLLTARILNSSVTSTRP
jgi:hypothetical protein